MSEYTEGKLELCRGRNKHYNPENSCYGSYELLQQTCFYICGPKLNSDFMADIVVEKGPKGKANAAELVRRWNAHEDLVKACRVGLAYINAGISGVPRPVLELSEDKEIIEAALAQAVEGN